jgi:hypothetical protein
MANGRSGPGRTNGDRLGQTAADIDEQRRALEAAGREEWDRATREGRNVTAQTTQELRALGARALSRAAGSTGDRPGEIFVTAARAPDDAGDGGRVNDGQRLTPAANVAFRPTLQQTIDNSPGKRLYMTLQADWDPSRSNGVTGTTTNEMLDAGEAYKNSYEVGAGHEQMASWGDYGDGSLFLETPESKVKTGSSAGADFASAVFPKDSVAGVHWHRDRGSDGFVDDPRESPYGDTALLKYGRPMATVYQGEVGWHVIENGRLKFIYPAGTMTQSQVDQMQRNLNAEQKKFYREP